MSLRSLIDPILKFIHKRLQYRDALISPFTHVNQGVGEGIDHFLIADTRLALVVFRHHRGEELRELFAQRSTHVFLLDRLKCF